MMVIKTFVKMSDIHGLGLFAMQPVKKGETVWVYDPKFDISFSDEEIAAMPEATQAFLKVYGYKWRFFKGKTFLDADSGRHMNHSDDPNTGDWPVDDAIPNMVALRDIAAGEELTCNYQEFEPAFTLESSVDIFQASGMPIANGHITAEAERLIVA